MAKPPPSSADMSKLLVLCDFVCCGLQMRNDAEGAGAMQSVAGVSLQGTVNA